VIGPPRRAAGHGPHERRRHVGNHRVFALVLALVAIIAFIVFVEAARRKIPVSYAKRHVGRQLVARSRRRCR